MCTIDRHDAEKWTECKISSEYSRAVAELVAKKLRSSGVHPAASEATVAEEAVAKMSEEEEAAMAEAAVAMEALAANAVMAEASEVEVSTEATSFLSSPGSQQAVSPEVRLAETGTDNSHDVDRHNRFQEGAPMIVDNPPPETISSATAPAEISKPETSTCSEFQQSEYTPVIDENRAAAATTAAVGAVPTAAAAIQNHKADTMINNMDTKLVASFYKDGASQNLTFNIWDVGGQEIFYHFQRLYLTRYGVYLLCFDMSKIILDKQLSYLRFWLKSIEVHASGAPVLLVGTHKDAVSSPADHQLINELLQDSLKLHENDQIRPCEDPKLYFFPLDNTMGNTDPIVEALRRAIEQAARKDEKGYIDEELPLNFLETLDALKGPPYRHLEEVVKIALENGIENRQSVIMMLYTFHELGVLLHFVAEESCYEAYRLLDAELPGPSAATTAVGFAQPASLVEDFVVLDPQWLLNNLTLIIRDRELHPDGLDLDAESELFRSDWKEFLDKAIISELVLRTLWRTLDEQEQNFLTDLMQNIGLACRWPWEVNKDCYLIPSLLREGSLDESRIQSCATHFILDFSKFCLPASFFPDLLCRAVASSLEYAAGGALEEIAKWAQEHGREEEAPTVTRSHACVSFASTSIHLAVDSPRNRIMIGIDEKTSPTRGPAKAAMLAKTVEMTRQICGRFKKVLPFSAMLPLQDESFE